MCVAGGWVGGIRAKGGFQVRGRKRGVLERSEKPWGGGEGGVRVFLRVHGLSFFFFFFARARALLMRVHLPSPQACAGVGREGQPKGMS